MQEDIATYVGRCMYCQAHKVHHYRLKAPLHPIPVPDLPFRAIATDLIGPLPTSNGYDAVLVITCRLLKRIAIVNTNVTLSSEGFARLLRDNWVCHYGLPELVLSDRGPQFDLSFIKELYSMLGIKGTPSTAYHPQTDGQTERVNQEIETYIRFYMNHLQNDWSDWTSMAMFAYNDHVHSSTKVTPHYASFGIHPYKGQPSPPSTPHNQAGLDFAKRFLTIRDDLKKALLSAQDSMKRYHDHKKGLSWNIKVDDLVWLEGTNIMTNRPTKKLEQRRYGPFKVLSKIGTSAYKLQLPTSWSRLHPVFNEVLLTPYVPPSFPGQPTIPPPPPEIIVDDHVEYEVESVRDLKIIRGKAVYLVHWKDTLREDDTWEPVANLENAPDAIAAFHDANPSFPYPSTTPKKTKRWGLSIAKRSISFLS